MEELITVNGQQYRLETNVSLTQQQKAQIIKQLNEQHRNNIVTLSPASCPSSIPQGATRNVTVAVDASPNNGTPPYVYRLYVDNVEKIRYPTSGTTPNTSHIFSWTFNESVGSHTYKGQVTDSCSPTPKVEISECTIDITTCNALTVTTTIATS